EAEHGRIVHAKWDAVRFAAGVHPHSAGPYVGRASEAAAITRTTTAGFRACAIGEIGLDYHYDFAPRDVQREVFAAQLDLARDLDLPVVVHTREATDDTFALLAAAPGVRGVFHCFTGDAAMARRALDIGFYVSFAGIVTFPKAADLREAAAIVPADRLLIETDSPYLAPVPHRGQRNEPSFVGQVLAALATVRREDPRTLEARVTENFRRFFLPSHVG
ncbi:MAG TPA: TatD family hydrolase, partial [Vicinamibacterales bacterium]|nr:TatD family hydrolase [Vicinamibacterales bacterium]